MGTRNLTMVIRNGKPKIAQYGQWDGYPSGQGIRVLEFLQLMDKDKFNKQLDKCRFANKRTPEHMYTMRYNSRDVCAGILEEVYDSQDDRILLVNYDEFIVDGLFCEWAYVIDLDRNVLQVYEGFKNGKLKKDDRFYYLQKRVDRKKRVEDKKLISEGKQPYVQGNEYHCELAHEFDLNNLPTESEFLTILKPK